MNKTLEVILPKVILDIVSNFVFYVPPKHGKKLRNNYLDYMIKHYSHSEKLLYLCETGDILGSINITLDMSTIMYLHDIGELSKTDVMRRKIFAYACKDGHYPLVEYLTKTYNLSYYDVTCNDNEAFGSAYVNGHYKITDYLTQTYDLDCEETFMSPEEIAYQRYEDVNSEYDMYNGPPHYLLG